MKVVCRRVVSATTGEELERSPWLTIGREYSVLEIVASPDGGVSLRLVGDPPSLRFGTHGCSKLSTATCLPAGRLGSVMGAF